MRKLQYQEMNIDRLKSEMGPSLERGGTLGTSFH